MALSEEQKAEIIKLRKGGVSYRGITRETGVSGPSISKVLKEVGMTSTANIPPSLQGSKPAPESMTTQAAPEPTPEAPKVQAEHADPVRYEETPFPEGIEEEPEPYWCGGCNGRLNHNDKPSFCPSCGVELQW